MNPLKFIKKIPVHLTVAASGWVSRIVVVATQLISIPIFYHQLGLENFAVFTIITSLVSWYSLTDFGLGNALQNYISEYRSQDKNPAILLTKTAPLLIIILIFLAIIFISFGHILQTWLFSDLQNPLSSTNFIICMILYCWYFILLISSKIFFAYQKGFYGYLYQSITYFILLIIMAIIHFFNIKITLTSSLYIWILPLFFSGLLGFAHAFYHAGAKIKPFHWDSTFLNQLKTRAFKFWLVSLSANGVLAIDYLVIVKLLSAKDIVTYNIVNKIFVMMLFGYAAVLSALWPVLAEKYATKNVMAYNAAERELKRSILGGIIYMILMTIMAITFRDTIVHLFKLQQAISLPISLLLLFGIYGCIRVWTDTYTTAFQARSSMKLFLMLTPIQAIIAITLMLLLVKYGLMGIMIALILSFVIIPVWVLPFYHYKNLRSFRVSA